MRLPPPATPLTMPAPSPARTSTTICDVVMDVVPSIVNGIGVKRKGRRQTRSAARAVALSRAGSPASGGGLSCAAHGPDGLGQDEGAVVRARFGSAASAGGTEAGTIRRARRARGMSASAWSRPRSIIVMVSVHSGPRTRETSPGSRSRMREEFAPVLLRHAAHDEDGGRGKVRGHRQFGETVGGYLGILEQAQLVLELRQLPGVALGAPGVELGAEFERIAKSLTADAEPMEIGRFVLSASPDGLLSPRRRDGYRSGRAQRPARAGASRSSGGAVPAGPWRSYRS